MGNGSQHVHRRASGIPQLGRHPPRKWTVTRRFLGASIGLLVFGSAHAEGLPACVGNYRLANGHVVTIAEWEVDRGTPHLLVFTDFRTGRIGVLTRAGRDQWSLPERLLSGEEASRLRLERAGDRVVGLSIRTAGTPPRRAVRIDTRNQDVTFSAGDTTLGGTLWLPPGKGPFPAVVIVPAGALGRAGDGPFTEFFLSEGLAVLAYDRRSQYVPFPRYADDAVAAVEALRRRAEIDPRRVGLWGHSQGGWLSLIAAARSPHVAFVIDHSGMLVPAWEQELYRVAAEALADSTPRDVVQEALAFETKLMRVAATGEGWSDLAARLAIEPVPAWHALVYKPKSLAELQEVWRDDYSFDPRPFVAAVRQPVLALYGGLDRSTPIESAAQLVSSVGKGARVQVAFFPTADHAFLEARTGGNAEIPSLSRFTPGMFDTLRAWLKRRHLSDAATLTLRR